MVKGHGITGWAIANNRDIVANHAEMDFRPDIREEMPPFSDAAVFAMSSSADRKASFGALTLYLDNQELMPAFMRRRIKQLVEQISRRLEQLLEGELTRSSPLSDPVTHLPTLSLLYAHAAREIAQARRHKFSVSFMEMELDNYQEILLRNGKDETEKFLREIAKSVRRYLRDGDVLARISESEFAGVFPLTEHAQVQFLVRRLRNCVDRFQYQTASGESIRAEASFGCATFPEQGKTCESLFLRANTQRFADKMHPEADVAAGSGVHCGKVLPFRL
jgi:diguanylate cyclase (GGDEF)-like protein